MKTFFPLLGILFLINCTSVDSSQTETEDPPVTQPVAESEWTTINAEGEPLARHENAFTELNGKFYLIGGRKNKPINIYDPATNKWSEGAMPPLEMHHFQALPFQDKIYVLGAFTGGFPHETPIPDVYAYVPATNQWEKVASIPESRRRGAAGVVAYQDKIYVLCGIQDGHYDGHVAWLDEYNPATGEWIELPDAPRPRDHFQGAVKGTKLYAAGGRNTSAKTKQTMELTIDEVDVYDFSTGEWMTLENQLPTERAGATSIVVDDQLIVIGGESGSQVPAHSEVEALDLKKLVWRVWPSLKQGRHGTQGFLHKESLYIAAGSGDRGGGPELTSLEKYTVAENK
ncbi:Kelch repeat-containing protein [Tunicatimonas pelagia]|uniref:Kelch repeat-containing protein n=1 Tax=Tunicatimonas pelagia TaxID=931531 RepID=UPI002665BF44|nr:kelch repeat-containing protein [Tunicatimonas pelagia]WKN43367.1 kelch repeat-containing protein [Tunicatimonas pelagia]